MKIRTRLILSYVIIIGLLSLGFIFLIRTFVLKDLREKNLTAADQAVAQIAEVNYELSKKVLTAYGERIVELKAEASASQLALLLSKVKQPFDYDALRADDTLRAAATPNILTWNGVAGYIDVYDTNGISIWHPNKKVEGRNFAEWKDEFPTMWKLVVQSFTEDHVAGYYTFLDKKTQEPKRKYMVLLRVPDTPFIVASTVYINDYFLPVHKKIRDAEKKAMAEAETSIRESSSRLTQKARMLTLLAVAGVSAVGILFALFFSNSIASPIQRLEQGVQKIGAGDFAVQIEEKGPPEIVTLAGAFNKLGKQLTIYIENLRKEIAARQIVESEIAIARKIQESLVPHTFPPFPNRKEFDLYGNILPAMEVAGDYYDFFVKEDKLILIVGDVSGKSVPAAFFMAITRTLIRSICHHKCEPGMVLTTANKILMQDNDACMFVTLFLACYDIKTGVLTYANAGHPEAALLKKNGKVNWFGLLNDPVAGVMPVKHFHVATQQIEPGDSIVLYTDGVTEATSEEEELFGPKRLETLLEESAGMEPKALCKKIEQSVLDFQKGHLFDDATLLVLRRNT